MCHIMKATTVGREGGYNCVVCIKQVPDTKKVTGAAMKPDGTVNRALRIRTPSRRLCVCVRPVVAR